MMWYKNLLPIFIFSLLCFSCKNELATDAPKATAPATKPIDPAKRDQIINKTVYIDSSLFTRAKANIEATDQATFDAAPNHENKTMPVEKFCNESKGYQADVWEGINDCAWAVEKYCIEQNSEWVSREGDELKLLTRNGNYVSLKHDLSNPLLEKHYLFKNYYEIPDYFVVEIYQKSKCLASRMVNTETGSSFLIKGNIYFSKDQSVFVASTFNPESPIQCPNKIDYYAFANGQLTKKWHIPTGNWGLTDVRFVSNKELLIEQSTTDLPGEKRYARIAMQ